MTKTFESTWLLRGDDLPGLGEAETDMPEATLDGNELAGEEQDWVIKQTGIWDSPKCPEFQAYLSSLIEDWKSKGGDAVDLWAFGLYEYERLKEERLFNRHEVSNPHSFLGLIYEYISQTESPESIKELYIEWTFLYAEDVQRKESQQGIISDTPQLIAKTAMDKYPEYQSEYDTAA